MRSMNVQENNISMLVPFSMLDEHLNCCLIKMINMADLNSNFESFITRVFLIQKLCLIAQNVQ